MNFVTYSHGTKVIAFFWRKKVWKKTTPENPFILEFDPDYTIQTVIKISYCYEKNILR